MEAGKDETPGLLERSAELAALERQVDAAAAGEGGVALIEGPAGIGKTMLLAETRRLARESGIRILTARAGELESDFPYGAVRQLFEPAISETGSEELLAGGAEPARSIFESGAATGEDGGSFATLHGLYWLTLNLAGDNPLLLAIDDLHWCDRPSLRYVAYLARRLEGAPVLLAATLRSTEPGTDPVLISEIARDPLARSISPSPLTQEAVSSVVSMRLGGSPDRAFVHACHEATGGNPLLLLRELLSALAAESVEPRAGHVDRVGEVGPRAVSRSVLLRLSRLSADAAATARAAAVLGKAGDIAHVAELAGLAEADVGAATGELARDEILLGEVPLRFVHPLIREAIYLDIAPGDRQLQHARAAELLTAAGAAPEEVATHLLLTPPRGDPTTVELLLGAARSAGSKGAPDSAMAYLRRAVAEPPPAESVGSVRLQLGLAEALVEPPAAIGTLALAREESDDPAERALAASVQAPIMILTGNPTAGSDLAREAAAELPPDMEDERRALEAIAFSGPQFAAGDPEDSDDLEPHRKLPLPPGGGAKMLASIASLRWAHAGGGAGECSELALAALEGDEMMERDGGFVAVCAHQVLAMAGREEVMPELDKLNDLAHSRGSIFLMSGVQLFRGIALRLRGELAEAEEVLREGVEYFDRWGFAAVFFRAFLASTLLARGDTAGAREQLDKTGDIGDWSEGARFWLHTHLETMLEEGRHEKVLAGAEDFSARFAHLTNVEYGRWRSLRARALDRLGRGDEDPGLLDEELELARRWGAPGTVGATLCIRGELRGGEGTEDLEEAVAVLEGSTARLELALALAALGTRLRLDRRPTDARDPLRRALELATACSADGLVEHCRAELAAAGARPRREALSGVASLTPSERRVADLAVGAMTNREIAQTLYVTPKTVEVHLSNAYRKLDIRSRRELPEVLSPT